MRRERSRLRRWWLWRWPVLREKVDALGRPAELQLSTRARSRWRGSPTAAPLWSASPSRSRGRRRRWRCSTGRAAQQPLLQPDLDQRRGVGVGRVNIGRVGLRLGLGSDAASASSASNTRNSVSSSSSSAARRRGGPRVDLEGADAQRAAVVGEGARGRRSGLGVVLLVGANVLQSRASRIPPSAASSSISMLPRASPLRVRARDPDLEVMDVAVGHRGHRHRGRPAAGAGSEMLTVTSAGHHHKRRLNVQAAGRRVAALATGCAGALVANVPAIDVAGCQCCLHSSVCSTARTCPVGQ